MPPLILNASYVRSPPVSHLLEYADEDIGNWESFLDELNDDTWHQLMGAYYFHVYEKKQLELTLKRRGYINDGQTSA